MDDIERFAEAIRQAGKMLQMAARRLVEAEAEEKRLTAQSKVQALAKGFKTNAAQDTYADEDTNVFQARLARGVAKGEVSAAKANLLAAEVEFKTWQSKLAYERSERRVYGA